MKHNQHIWKRYQKRSWYLEVIFFFILVGCVLYITRTKTISPCQMQCSVKVVVQPETKTELHEIVDYILTTFAPSGRNAQTEALACFISESGLRPNAYNWNPPYTDKNGVLHQATDDKGIAQINSIHGMGDKAYDWKKNIEKAYQLYKEQGWSIWYGWGCGR